MKVLRILVQLSTNLFQLFFHRLTQRNLDFLVHPLLVAFLSSFAPQMFKTQTEAVLRVCTADQGSSAHSPAPQEHPEMLKKKKYQGKFLGESLSGFFFTGQFVRGRGNWSQRNILSTQTVFRWLPIRADLSSEFVPRKYTVIFSFLCHRSIVRQTPAALWLTSSSDRSPPTSHGRTRKNYPWSVELPEPRGRSGHLSGTWPFLQSFFWFYAELRLVGKDSKPLRWQPAISGSCIQTLQRTTRAVSQRRD